MSSKETSRLYYLSHKHQVAEKATRWSKNNPAKRKQISRKSYEKHRTKVLARSAERRKQNPEQFKVWSKKSKDKRKTHKPFADKEYHLNSKFGIGLDEFNVMLSKQNGGCSICGTQAPGIKGWHVDHDHKKKKGDSGFIRGILCCNCNHGLGNFKDSVKTIIKAAKYLGYSDSDIIVEGINQVVKTSHDQAVQGGWWSNLETGEPLIRNKGELLMLAVSEIAEAMEGERKNLMDDKLSHRKMSEVEIGDCVIRLGDFCGAFGYDLGNAIVEKLKFNASREDHKIEHRRTEHGKRF